MAEIRCLIKVVERFLSKKYSGCFRFFAKTKSNKQAFHDTTVYMATRMLTSLHTEVLPENCVITAQGVETHALQEGIIDGMYRVVSYDPGLQSPETQVKYGAFTPLYMAALALRAMGVDWATTKAAVAGETNAIPPELDKRLENTLFAGQAIGHCYREGLLRAKVIPDDYATAHDQNLKSVDAGIEPQSLGRDQLVVLSLLARGAISQHDHPTLDKLRQLEQRCGGASNMLLLLTKTVATRLQPAQTNPAIVHRRESAALSTPYEVKVEEEQASSQDMSLRFRSSCKPRDVDRRQAFTRYLQLEINNWSEQPNPTVRWKDTAFTFHLSDLTPDQRAATILTTFGIPTLEVQNIAKISKVPTVRQSAYAKLKLPFVAKFLPQLFLLQEEHITYDQPVALKHEPHKPNLRLLQQTVTDRLTGSRTVNFSGEEKAKVYRYIYNQIGVTCLAEAFLALGTQGLIQLQPFRADNTAAYLTDRQRAVMDRVACGHSNASIARELQLSIDVVKQHVSALIATLGVSNRGGIMAHVNGIRDLQSQAGLTPAEAETVELIARGYTDKMIADQLNRSYHTVKSRIQGILRKTGTNNRQHAVAKLYDIVDS